MKKSFTTLLLGAVFYILTGGHGAMAQEPLEFQGSIFNPVVTSEGPGTYDEMLVAPYCLWDDGTFYLFYCGMGGPIISVVLATSTNGRIYSKYAGNPLLSNSGTGFDSLGAGGPAVVLKVGSQWVMYYNARQFPGYGPGESTGRATADNLTGPWTRSSNPALTIGNPGEWDAGLINTNSVLPLDTGGFIMFYYASDNFNGIWLMGMATSPDGITWTKYNDPATTDPPYADSDPVMPAGNTGEFDAWGVAGAGVLHMGTGSNKFYHMYYAGYGPDPGPTGYRTDIGYAYSTNGIHWEKWPENPVYVQEDDPHFDPSTMIFEQPCLVIQGETVYMYYDYGTWENAIGLATALNPWVGNNEKQISIDDLRLTNFPNPVNQATTFTYSLSGSSQVKLEIFDSFGRLVDVPVNGFQSKGDHHFNWSAEGYPAGIFFYRLDTGGKSHTGKFVVAK